MVIDWIDRSSWAFVPPGFYVMPEVFEAVGRKVYDEEWIGAEKTPVAVLALPTADEVYGPCRTVYVTDEGEPTDYELYSDHSERAAALIGARRDAFKPLSEDQWHKAYCLSIDEVAAANATLSRRVDTFKCLQRLAAAGHLRFLTRDDRDGSMCAVSPHFWNCRFEVALPRFEHEALSIDVDQAMLPPPPPGPALAAFNRTFVIDLFVTEENLLDVLNNIYFEPIGGRSPDITDLRATALLQAAGQRATSDLSAQQQDRASPSQLLDDAGRQRGRVPLSVDVREVVTACAMKRAGVEPTRAAVKLAFPDAAISRNRIREMHASIWAELYGEAPTRGANPRNDRL